MKSWLFLAGAASGLALALVINADQRSDSAVAQQAAALAQQAAPARTVPADQSQLLLSYSPVAKRAAPAVVNVYTARRVQNRGLIVDPFFQFFFGQGRLAPAPRIENSLGSGVIVQPDGLIVTNYHVVDGAEEILVALADRREFPARVIFSDQRSDLAALRIEGNRQPLPVLPLGDSDRVEVGDVVLAIGNPFGVGQTVTHGIVSATARNSGGINDWQFFLQTDAPINPGNSGGALVSSRGELIGINTAIYSRSGGSQGIGFAIPSNMVRQFIEAARTGRVVRAWIGAHGEALTFEEAAAAGLDRPVGVRLTDVTPGSPADRAGLRPGDIIYAIGGAEIADPGMLRYRIATQQVGTRLTATVVRDGRARNVELELAAPPESPPRQVTRIGGDNLLTGVTVANLSPALAQELGGALPERGVVVIDVDPRAPAARLDLLQPSDVIEAINGEPVATVDALREQLERGTLALQFNRQGQQVACALRPAQGLICRQSA